MKFAMQYSKSFSHNWLHILCLAVQIGSHLAGMYADVVLAGLNAEVSVVTKNACSFLASAAGCSASPQHR